MEKQLLIVGIDPGTTIGYAIMNLNGDLLKIDSSKQLSLSLLINEVIKHGKIVIVGSDVNPPSSFVNLFATKFGAKLIYPKESLLVKEKKELTKDYDFKDNHQMDALSSAILCYKKMFPLIKKLDNYIMKNNKQQISNELKEIVIKKRISIKDALGLIEDKNRQEVKTETPKINIKQEITSKLIKLEQENLSSKNRINGLINNLKKISYEKQVLYKKLRNKNFNKKLETLFYFKDQRINSLSEEINLQRQQIELLKNKINILNEFILSLSDKILIKKLNNLGSREFQEKNKFLKIKSGDILLIENTSIISENVINELKELVTYVIHKNDSNETLKENFTLINTNEIKLIELDDFALVEKEEFEKIKKNKNILSNILKDYKNERIS